MAFGVHATVILRGKVRAFFYDAVLKVMLFRTADKLKLRFIFFSVPIISVFSAKRPLTCTVKEG